MGNHACDDCGKFVGHCECPRLSAKQDILTEQDHAGLAKAFNDMQAKMRVAAEKGRDGWHDPALCPAYRLRAMLADAVRKGDPVDVMNLAMMLNARNEPTYVEGEAVPIPPYLAPSIPSVWRHRNGNLYMVYGLSNEASTDQARYPTTVHYIGENGNRWSRPLSRWDDSMSYVANPSEWNFDRAWSSLNPWYQAVTEGCAVAGINWHMDNPRQTINDLISWHVQVALDPRVSSDAAALVEQGKVAGREEQSKDILGQLALKELTTRPPLKERLHGKLEVGRDPQYEPWSSFSPKQWTRVAVPGGWVVQSGVSMVFVPDPEHAWV